jgi:hypothetical protein
MCFTSYNGCLELRHLPLFEALCLWPPRALLGDMAVTHRGLVGSFQVTSTQFVTECLGTTADLSLSKHEPQAAER